MPARNGASARHRCDGAGAQEGNAFGKRATSSRSSSPTSIQAELTGSTLCSALDITVTANAPVIELCRSLIEAGFDPDLQLEAYRGDVMCIRVKSIGAAAKLEIGGDGTSFRPRREPDAASPMRSGEPDGVSSPPIAPDDPAALQHVADRGQP